MFSDPAVSHNKAASTQTVYVTSADPARVGAPRLFAINAASGELRWVCVVAGGAAGGVLSPPIVSRLDGTVFFGSSTLVLP